MLVTAQKTGQSDGSVKTQFNLYVDTNQDQYDFDIQQESLSIWNKGYNDIVLNVGSYANQTISPGSKWENSVSFSSFTIKTSTGASEFLCTSRDLSETEEYKFALMEDIANLKYHQITDHCQIYSALSDGTDTGVTYNHYYTAMADCYDLKLIYGNFYIPSTEPIVDTDAPNDITIKASICVGSYGSSLKIYPLKFNGSDSLTIKPGGVIETDTLGIELKKGDNFYVRTYVSVASAGLKYPLGMSTYFNYGEGKTTGDVTVSGTVTSSAGSTYHPIAIIGMTSKKAILLSGDSIFTNSSGSTIAITGGYAGLALHNNNIPYTLVTRVSDQVNYFMNNGLARKYRMRLAKYADYVICDYGINDISAGRTFAQVQADLINLWNMYISRGYKVFQCTITPKTTSTDGWTTTANQTVSANNPVRTQINDWIRTCPSPLNGYFEIADLAETSRNSGIWKAGYTTDGLHPTNTTGHTALAVGIDTSKFV